MSPKTKPGRSPKRLARQLDAGLIDRPDLVGAVVAFEHDPAAAERVGDQAVRAVVHVGLLDLE